MLLGSLSIKNKFMIILINFQEQFQQNQYPTEISFNMKLCQWPTLMGCIVLGSSYILLFAKMYLFLFYARECFAIMLSMCTMYMSGSHEGQKEHQISQNWGYRRLWTVTWMLGTEPGPLQEQ